MPSHTRQISLPLDLAGRAERDFIVSAANDMAVRHLAHWGTWPVRVSVLVGPPRSGRSLLAQRFATESGGRVIDDAESEPEEMLFHAWNAAQESGRPLLLVASRPPAQWGVALPDLASRLSAAPVVTLQEPDDALALALIEQGLGQAGTAFSPDLPPFLAARLERSYGAIGAAVDHLNQLSLSSNRKISIPVAKETLSGLGLLLL